MQWKRTEDCVPSSLIPEGLRVGARHVEDILPLERCRAFVVPHLKSHHGTIVQTGKLAIDEASQDDARRTGTRAGRARRVGSHVDGVDPGLDILELLRGDGVNAHPRLIVLADEHHVEVLEVVRDTLKVCDLELVGVEHEEGRLGEVDEAVLRRHEERLAAAAQKPTTHSFQRNRTRENKRDEGQNLML